ncbi:inactive glycosyltransferase 25 family member 3 [Rhinatrema bivittatum]|uniref:inactive glycosyltransferase 25 family member 3 n=1 Tax=Rhinatrema bivittatum TaxID=194408 RepID=UPI001125E7E6|nr:inactive glycosyltransferase 25 family member 3 [Rhinatrema bivittatum]
MLHAALLLLYGFLLAWGRPAESEDPEAVQQLPTVVIAIAARNAVHSLPYFLGALERLDYPKHLISIWCATDHNADNTTMVLQQWLLALHRHYHSIEWRPQDEPLSYPGELGPKHWLRERYEHLLKLKQAALNFARRQRADYILYLDTDSILTNNQTLKLLIAENRSVIAPMLDSQTFYSNFWCGITPQGYYRRTTEYFPTKNRLRRGCFHVPMVFAAFLIDLRKKDSKKLGFYPPRPSYSWSFDDIIIFAHSCLAADAQVYLCNQQHFGYINIPAQPHHGLEEERLNFLHLLLGTIVDGSPMIPSQHVFMSPKYPDKMGFDEVFLINLMRRSDRRQRMLHALYEQEISCEVIDAVDGSAMNSSDIKKLGVDLLPGYYDPFSGRTLTKGEVGCFLSHFTVWKEVVERQLDTALVMEDDVRFEGFFKQQLMKLMEEINETKLDWDLIYLGRKQVNSEPEEHVEGVRKLVRASYSYWTLAYVISQQGAQKLLNAEPLSRMLPVDEFLPIMSDTHPNEQYKVHFVNRNLKVFSVHPLLVYPVYYADDPDWVSDTETSTIWDNDAVKTEWKGSQKTRRDFRGDLRHSEL